MVLKGKMFVDKVRVTGEGLEEEIVRVVTLYVSTSTYLHTLSNCSIMLKYCKMCDPVSFFVLA